jgi:hypothetical protein
MDQIPPCSQQGIIALLVAEQIGKLVIGKNRLWKQTWATQ